MLQSVLLLYLQHHLCNIRSPHPYLSPPGRGIKQKTPGTLVCQSIILPNYFLPPFVHFWIAIQCPPKTITVHEKLAIVPTVVLHGNTDGSDEIA